jgi:hypothetical protein
MTSQLETRFVVVVNDSEYGIRAVAANSGRNGGETNHTYKTIAGASRRLKEAESEFGSRIIAGSIFEISLDVVTEGQGEARARAVRAAKRFGFY